MAEPEQITPAEAAELIAAAEMTGIINPRDLAAQLNAQLAATYEASRATFIANLGANPLPEAIAAAENLAAVQAKGFLLDFTGVELNRMGATIAQGLKEGLHSTEIARRLRDQVGLTASGSARVDKLRAALEANGLDASTIEAQLAKYTDKLIADRAETIARAEVNRAVSGADLANALADGDKYKAWQTSGDAKVTDECQANEAVGWIPIDDEFPSHDQHPPRTGNPNCRCNVVFREAKPSKEAQDRAAARAERTAAAKSE